MSEIPWPASCTLPTAERPTREAEFDTLFASWVLAARRVDRLRLRLELDPSTVEAARDLAARETSCCSFFTFTFEERTMDIAVSEPHVEVLDAMAERVGAR